MKIVLDILSLLYLALIKLRLLGYQKNLFKRSRFLVPVFSIGNISVGGTGKTPMEIYVSQLLTKQNIKHVIVSRGYKKSSKGPVVVQGYNKKYIDSPVFAGDEPIMMTYKLKNIPIVVDNRKHRGISLAIKRFSPQIILLDDGFQSLYIDKTKDCVLIDNSLPIEQYQLIPRGQLREPVFSLKRSDFVVFINKGSINNSIKDFVVPILNENKIPFIDASFKSTLYQHNYNNGSLEKHSGDKPLSLPCVVFAGIANPQGFFDSVKIFCENIVDCYDFQDHYNYQKNQRVFENIINKNKVGVNSNLGIITTLKDYVKIVRLPNVVLNKYSLYVLDINVVIDSDQKLLELFLGKG